MKNLFFLIVLFFLGFTKNVFSQDTEIKYLTAIIYLQNNKLIQDELRKEFKKKISNECIINFEVSEKISFIGIDVFDDYFDNLDNSSINIETFYKDYFFESIENPLNNLLHNGEKSIKIHFSKPVKNFLLVELSIKDYGENSMPKFGKSIKVILFFDENNRIQKSLFETFINN